MRAAALLALACLAACKPPAADDERGTLAPERAAPSEPLGSPDTQGAIWAMSSVPNRIIFGQPGQPPLVALACDREGVEHGTQPLVRITRFAPADPHAQAYFALIGNGHIARVPVDAVERDGRWIWEGVLEAAEQDWEAMTGPRAVTGTLPGAGMVRFSPSPLPAQIIDACRFAPAPPAPQATGSAEAAAPLPRDRTTDTAAPLPLPSG